MVIEFCGLPGVGKSTTARALEAHGFVKVRIGGVGELFYQNILYAFRFPLAWVKMLVCVLRSGFAHGRLYPLFMNVFLHTNARIMKARRTKAHAIIDQGHLQALLSLSYHDLTSKEVIDFLRYLPRPDRVVVCVAPDDVRSERITVRGYGPRDNEKHAEAWLAHITHNMDVIHTTIVQREQYPVLLLMTNKPTDQLVEEVKAVM
jgi:broad-specificity NMP kinase